MPNIVETGFFATEPLYIPNRVSMNVAAPGAPTVEITDLQSLIDFYEPQLLINAFGITYYNELQIALTLQPFDPGAVGVADQKWIDLVNGHTYEIDGVEYMFEGLKGRNNNSLIAWYVKAMYLYGRDEVVTTLGVGKLQGKGAEARTHTNKFVRAWQNFMSLYQAVDSRTASIALNDFGTVGLDFTAGRNNVRSLYQYFLDLAQYVDDTRFPDLNFAVVPLEESYNSFGI